jgi:septal ring factor EnvC (AmiA/AmiB activator)
MPGSEQRAGSGAGDATTSELIRRLREQAEQNADLDAEVRYLQQELRIRNEFVRELEAELASLHELAGSQRAAIAEYSAYRARVSHRTVDRLVARAQRVPWLYRPLRLAGRRLIAWRTDGAGGPTTARGPELPAGSDEG